VQQHFTLGQAVSSSFSCADPAGVSACAGPRIVDTSTVGTHTFAVSASDRAGNRSSKTVTYVVDPIRPSVQLKSALRRTLVPHGRAGKLRAIVRHQGYVVSFTAPTAGRLTLRWYTVARGAQRARVLVARGVTVFPDAVRRAIGVKLTAQGKRMLRHAKRLRIEGKASFNPAPGGAATTITRRFTLTR
jgi:hypothetical protein